MKTLTNAELANINGGAIKWGLITIFGGLISVIAGFIDGFINPLKCRK
jgi:lactobin A/cerein 7B family class IIb bacteriocin